MGRKVYKGINTVDDFNDYCEDMLTFFCEKLEGDSRYTRPLTEEEKEYYLENYPTVSFMYTNKGHNIIERYIGRLYKIGIKYFDELDLDIQTSWFQELD